jgi:hypothetical protein
MIVFAAGVLRQTVADWAADLVGQVTHSCQFAEHLYRLRGVFCWKTQGFQGEGGDATTSGGIMAG